MIEVRDERDGGTVHQCRDEEHARLLRAKIDAFWRLQEIEDEFNAGRRWVGDFALVAAYHRHETASNRLAE